MDTYESGGRELGKKAKRKSILDAAVKVFLNEGFESTSMDRIAEVALASKRTVYNYFPSKDDLLRAVIESFNDEMKTLKNIPYDRSRSLEEQLSDWVEVEILVVRNQTWMSLIRFMLSIFIRYPDRAKEAMMKYATSETGLNSWMKAASLDGKLDTEDPSLAAKVFSSLVGGAFTWPSVYRGEGGVDVSSEFKQEIVRTFLARYGKN